MNKTRRKGIILAGGKGTRLSPLTKAVCKQLLPVYDKPMIFYPLQTLLSAGITDITIIVSPDQLENFKRLFDDIECNFTYRFVVQEEPKGIAEAFILAEEYIGDCPVALVLGDNLFCSDLFHNQLSLILDFENVIFGYQVNDPSAYGVVVIGEDQRVIDVVEKPTDPPSNYAIPGLYFFDNTVIEKAKNCKPSARGELEITDVIKQYIDNPGPAPISCDNLSNDTAWFDCGSFDDLIDAGNFVRAIEKRTNIKVGYSYNGYK